MNKIANGLYIPCGGKLYTLDEWMQQAHPENAQTVVLVTDFGMLEIAKEDLPARPLDFDFAEAQHAAASYGAGFRCPTRHEAIELYDARFRGLDEALRMIGGHPADSWMWTSETDPAVAGGSEVPYIHQVAFIFDGGTGRLGTNFKHLPYAVRPVRAFKTGDEEDWVENIESRADEIKT